MEKSTILSKAAIFAILALASYVSFSPAMRAQALSTGLPPIYRGGACSSEYDAKDSPVDKVKCCQTKADSKNTTCYPTGRPAFCNDGVCSCEDDGKDFTVDKAQICQTTADCKYKCPPTGRPAFCHNGVCSCYEAHAKDSPVVPKDGTCSTINDCKSTKCLPQPGWHVECVDGKCSCVFDVPPRSKVVIDKKCITVKHCKSTICMEEIGWHVECVNGICKCVYVAPP